MSNEAQTYAATLAVGDITAKFVLCRLADRADERFSCFPSVPLLAAEAEKSERVIQRALAKLREMKLVSDKERTRPDGSTASSRYFLHGPWDDYGRTGVPFATITTPKQKRAEQWAEPPCEGSFRKGTAAAEALSGKAPAPAPPAPDATPDPAPERAQAADAPTPDRAREQEGSSGVGRPVSKPPGNASPAKKQKAQTGRRMTREQAAAVAAVEAAWPAELAELLPKYRPDVIRDAVLDAVAYGRTADQLVERVRRRWSTHGYSDALSHEGKGIGSPVGVAVALVRPPADCPDPMCEDGTLLHLNSACVKCEQRRLDRRADRRQGQVPGPRADRRPRGWTCENPDCRKPGRGEAPGDGLCSACRQELQASAARLSDQLAADETERQRAADAASWGLVLEDAYGEHQEREDEIHAAAEREHQLEAEAAESRRIQAELLREHPELAQYAQA
ncbi:helix-turn-helix domain-containing protein [Streptomyces sp. NPDC060366]|uniref:helix-turn-helix domain-containing protein n=1 Tax=Streptomyces sp. NPDC060366 TaxID=3347105 RepID=UPI00364E8436